MLLWVFTAIINIVNVGCFNYFEEGKKNDHSMIPLTIDSPTGFDDSLTTHLVAWLIFFSREYTQEPGGFIDKKYVSISIKIR